MTTPETILVVEDDRNLLNGIQDILSLEGYHVMTAQDGQEALAALANHPTPPALILSDIMMPRMDGYELLDAVRQQPHLITVPFIFLTAKGEKEDIQDGVRRGVEDYITKPFNAHDLVDSVRAKIERSKSISGVYQGFQEELKRGILTILNHEFRTPLTFVVAYADMLDDLPKLEDGASDADLSVFLNGVKSGADRLRRLVENFILLVEFSTGNAAKTYSANQHRIEQLDELVELGIAKALMIPEEPRDYTLSITPNLPPIIGHDDFVVAAVMQLVDNALKFSLPDQPVAIRVYATDAHVCVQVEDKGRGIPEHERENIYRSFYQINRPKYEDQGAGAGLSIVRGVMELHGGDVALVSEVGVGSLFTLRFPCVTT